MNNNFTVLGNTSVLFQVLHTKKHLLFVARRLARSGNANQNNQIKSKQLNSFIFLIY